MKSRSQKIILETIVRSLEEMKELAANLINQFSPGSVIVLSGDLGAGKTTFIGYFCKASGIQAEITSPTFTIINEYPGKIPVYHFDFYRLTHVSEIKGLNIDDYLFGDGICFLEWGEKIEDILPLPHYHMNIHILGDNERKIKLEEHL